MIPPQVREALRAALPHADLDAAEAIGEGWAQAAFRVPTPDGDRVLRYPRLGSYRDADLPRLGAMALADLEREVRLLPALVAWGLPVPRDAEVLRDAGGHVVASLHRPVEGVPARRGAVRGRVRARLAQRLGEVLTRLHAFPRDRATALGLRDADLWEAQYRELVEVCGPMLGARSRAWLEGIVARFHADGGMAGAPRVLIHGDLSGDHILLDGGGRLSGLIDFGDAMVADPALDFAGLLNEFPPAFVEQVLAHYGGEVDPHLRRRMRWYIEVAPLYQVRYGHLVRGGRERVDGLRRLAARAAAATRREARLL